MKNKILIIIPYFGEFPNFFQLWLKSCEFNKDINWIIFTDNHKAYDYPSNVKVVYTEFLTIVDRIQKLFDFNISLKTPYKLCDFKPAYGHIIENEIAGYDFWGHCDVDLIFGKISNFVTDSILDRYDRIFSHGHFCLYRNSFEINRLYRNLKGIRQDYKMVFSSDESFSFDESGRTEGMNKLISMNNVRQYKKTTFDDIIPKHANFVSSRMPSKFESMSFDQFKKIPALFKFEDGILLKNFYFKDEIYESESMYVHFQRRPMKLELLSSISNCFIIIPNKFIDNQGVDICLFEKCKYRYTYPNYVLRVLRKEIQKKLKSLKMKLNLN